MRSDLLLKSKVLVSTVEATKRKYSSTGMDWKKIKVNIENNSKSQSEFISILDKKLHRYVILKRLYVIKIYEKKIFQNPCNLIPILTLQGWI